MNDEIIYADPKLKQRIPMFVALFVCVLFALVFGVWPHARTWLLDQDLATMVMVLQIVLFAIFAGLLPLAIIFFNLGWRILASNRFPPPGTMVIRDTPLLRGPAARVRGMVLLLLTSILASVAFYGCWILPMKFGQVFYPNP